ncbi:hypothetical protein SAMN05421504_109130 [Amycolatopsis xylanica]|uniref:MazG nucleotide pyrophosphohydrolase domain-containing protein n=1 Tax=Amycolatopsis xylanica TaxID=589385 RepID=A0A1H3Q5R6_9PSEU|nr:hypothetical protein [Amycolatopsis xylanica]SDZ08716.1 hypothetical protein SAMN05421504_109130 [Amycolatopsis xylanica]
MITKTETLGPFQPLWTAWNEADSEVKAKPIRHFKVATDVQFSELETHLGDHNDKAAANEVIDVISIALNLMRKLGYTPDEVAEIARDRAEQRMRGQAISILDKYQRLYSV